MTLTYLPHPNLAYRGNPLIECLGFPLTLAELTAKCRVTLSKGLDLTGVPEEHHAYYQRTVIDNLVRFSEPRDELPDVYDIQRRMIESGLQNRNPIATTEGSVNIMAILNAIEKDRIESKNKKGKEIYSFNVKKFGFHESEYSYLLAGLSGTGKTTLITSIIDAEPQIFEHNGYTDAGGIHHPLKMTQITRLYFKIDNRYGQKSVLKSILEAIDALTGEEYAYQTRNDDIRDLIAAVRKAAVLHGIGVIIFDEAQNLSQASSNDKIGSNEKVTLKFLEEIFNHVAIPTFFVGTFSVIPLFTKELTLSRRIEKDGSTMIASEPVDSDFWKRLCKKLFYTDFLKSQKTDLETFTAHIHKLSVGIPAVAVSLTRATLSYLTVLDKNEQDLSINALDHILRTKFKIIKEPLEALRNRDYAKYEDFKPMYLLEQIKEDNVNNQSAAVLEGPLKLKENPKKVLSDLEEENNIAKASDNISPDSIISDIDFIADGKIN